MERPDEMPCFVHQPGKPSEGEELCYSCCEKEVETINRKKEDAEWSAEISGGDEPVLNHGPLRCELCGKRLDYELEVMGEELGHFLVFDFDMRCGVTCFELFRLLECHEELLMECKEKTNQLLTKIINKLDSIGEIDEEMKQEWLACMI